jgi:ArsR family transcriptional regulator
MDTESALGALAALSQQTRLNTFRLLVKHQLEGLPAGEIARRMDVPQNTMSTHLAILSRSGLLVAERHSRSIVYRVDLDRFRALALFLMRDCCGGEAELCESLIAELVPGCGPEGPEPAARTGCHTDLVKAR